MKLVGWRHAVDRWPHGGLSRACRGSAPDYEVNEQVIAVRRGHESHDDSCRVIGGQVDHGPIRKLPAVGMVALAEDPLLDKIELKLQLIRQ